ncbi:MAG: DMT family transporter [Planctomycetota bacterium]
MNIAKLPAADRSSTGLEPHAAPALGPWHAHGERLGLLLMVISAAAFALMAAFAQLWLRTTPSQVIVFWRGLLMTVAFTSLARARGVSLLGQQTRKLFLRGLLGYGAVSCYFASVQRLPLGDAVILQYSHPVFVALIAPFLLGERTGRWHWWLLGLAFAGVALIVKPHGDLRVGALVGLSGAFMSGLAYMTVRSLSRTEHPLTILVWFPALTIPGALITAVLRGHALVPRDREQLLGHIAVVSCALVGQWSLTQGLARAGAARATAVSMAGPVFGLLLDWWFFSDLTGAVLDRRHAARVRRARHARGQPAAWMRRCLW